MNTFILGSCYFILKLNNILFMHLLISADAFILFSFQN